MRLNELKALKVANYKSLFGNELYNRNQDTEDFSSDLFKKQQVYIYIYILIGNNDALHGEREIK